MGLSLKKWEKLHYTWCVVHADRRVVIDGRFPEQCVIRVVSAMRTKESIGYKMVSHGSWSSQEKDKTKQNKKAKKSQSGKFELKKKKRKYSDWQQFKQSWLKAASYFKRQAKCHQSRHCRQWRQKWIAMMQNQLLRM